MNERAKLVRLILTNVNIHLVWAGATICWLAVWAFSNKNYTNDELVTTISLSLAISSMIVSVYSIFQSLFSSKTFSNLTWDLKNSATQIQQASSRVEGASRELSGKIDLIPARFDIVESQLKAIHDNSTATAAKTTEAADGKEKTASKKFEASTNGGIVALHAAIKSHKAKKTLDLSKAVPNYSKTFAEGYLFALRDAELIDFSDSGDAGLTITDTSKIDIDVTNADFANGLNREKEYFTAAKQALESFLRGDEAKQPESAE